MKCDPVPFHCMRIALQTHRDAMIEAWIRVPEFSEDKAEVLKEKPCLD